MKTAKAAFILLLLASPLSTGAIPATAQTMPDDQNVIEILNSGSTNTAGFRITIERAGKSTWSLTGRLAGRRYQEPGATKGEDKLSSKLVKQLFSDVEAAMPLSQFPDKGCAKSRSFGYTITIQYGAEKSPDLTCPIEDPKLVQLKADMEEVVKTLHVGVALPRHPSD